MFVQTVDRLCEQIATIFLQCLLGIVAYFGVIILNHSTSRRMNILTFHMLRTAIRHG